jgi:hypothetical protein
VLTVSVPAVATPLAVQDVVLTTIATVSVPTVAAAAAVTMDYDDDSNDPRDNVVHGRFRQLKLSKQSVDPYALGTRRAIVY